MASSSSIQEDDFVGWRFFHDFVLLTNVGFFSGLAIEQWVWGAVNVYIGMVLASIGQSFVLHFRLTTRERGLWAATSTIGWLVGGQLSQRFLDNVHPDRSYVVNVVLFPLIAGIVMGVPTYWVVCDYNGLQAATRLGFWRWIVLSAIGPTIQFPGMVLGGTLWWLAKTVPTDTDRGTSSSSAKSQAESGCSKKLR